MADAKVKVIKDERVLKAVRDIRGAVPVDKFEWTPDKQARLIWLLAVRNPHIQAVAGEKETERQDRLKKAYAQWEADWSNGRLAYPSNTARSLAASGECRAVDKFDVAADGPLA